MKINLTALPEQLREHTYPVYLIVSQTTALQQIALECIQSRFKKTEQTDQTNQTKNALPNAPYTFELGELDTLQDHLNTSEQTDLFTERKIVFIPLRQAISKKHSAVLDALCAPYQKEKTQPAHSTQPIQKRQSTQHTHRYIFTIPKLTPSIQKAAWFQAVNHVGLVVQAYAFNLAQTQKWLHARFKLAGFAPSPDALTFFAESLQGNLPLAHRYIELMQLAYGDDQKNTAEKTHTADKKNTHLPLTHQQISELIRVHPQFTVFDLADALRANECARALSILKTLLEHGEAFTLVLWAITDALRKKIQAGSGQMHAHTPMSPAHHVSPTGHASSTNHISPTHHLTNALQLAHQLDHRAKTQGLDQAALIRYFNEIVLTYFKKPSHV